MIEIKRKEGESTNSLLYRFSKIVKQSGILREARKNKNHSRKPNKRAKKDSTLYRQRKTAEVMKLKKLGKL